MNLLSTVGDRTDQRTTHRKLAAAPILATTGAVRQCALQARLAWLPFGCQRAISPKAAVRDRRKASRNQMAEGKPSRLHLRMETVRVCSPPDVAQGGRNGRNLINTLPPTLLQTGRGSRLRARLHLFTRLPRGSTRRPNGPGRAPPPRAMFECAHSATATPLTRQSSALGVECGSRTHSQQTALSAASRQLTGRAGTATQARTWPVPLAGASRAPVSKEVNVVRAPRHRRPAGARARAAARRRARAGRCTWRPRRRHPRTLATPSRRRPGGRTQPRPVGERKPVHEGRVPVSHGSAAMETRPEDGAPAAPESAPRPILAQERGRQHPRPRPRSGEK